MQNIAASYTNAVQLNPSSPKQNAVVIYTKIHSSWLFLRREMHLQTFPNCKCDTAKLADRKRIFLNQFRDSYICNF